MNINTLFPSKYLKAGDLNGREVTVEIDRLVIEKVGVPPKVEQKPVLYFRRATKGMILNRTNAMTIAAMYTPETDNWTGKRITLYQTRVNAFGGNHEVVRIKPQVPPAPKAEPTPEPPHFDDAEDVIDNDDLDDVIDTGTPVANTELNASAPSAGDVDYTTVTDRLTGNCLQFAAWCRSKHIDSAGPCSEGQYGYLAGLLDEIVDKPGAHRAILTAIVGRSVDSDNPPGEAMVSKLLQWLPETLTEKKGGGPNPDYKPEYVGCIKRIWDLCLEAEGQLTMELEG